MLFYTQIKREFRHLTWQRGQTYFREQRVGDVSLNGDEVKGRVRGAGDEAYETGIVMARGTIFSSKCTCPIHRVRETHCKHVAALAIWIVERGALLRSGVSAGKNGVAAAVARTPAPTALPGDGRSDLVIRHPQRAAADGRLRKLLQLHPFLASARFIIRRDMMAGHVEGRDLSGREFSIPVTVKEALALLQYAQSVEPAAPEHTPAEAVLFVRGVFQSKSLSAISVESAVRYRDPQTSAIQVHLLPHLTRMSKPGLWKTSGGLLVQVPPPSSVADSEANFIQRLDTSKVFYHGQEALENLGRLLMHRNRDQIVFDPAVNIHVEPLPLKLVSLKIGAKVERSRQLGYEFAAGALRLSSDELDELARQGRLSANFVWRGDRILRFETSLTRLQQFTNRSGVAAPEAGAIPTELHDEIEEKRDQEPSRAQAFGAVLDEAQAPLHPLTAYRLSLEMGVENFTVDDDWSEFHEWRKTFEKKKVASLPEVDYGFDLRAYQKNGLSWMWSLYHRGLSALLADEMGLGKTHQVLAFLTTLYTAKKGRPKAPTLVVAPTSVIAAWQQKLKKYPTQLSWHVYHGKGRVLPAESVDLVLTTYGILQRSPELREKQWHIVVLDEAQAIKNAATLSARAARLLKSRFRIAMTGTPVENQATDLWSLMEFLLPGYLGTLPRFKRLYGWGRDVPPEIQVSGLRRMITPFTLRRTKAQVLKELPDKIEEVVPCEMTAAQRRAYRACITSADAERVRESLRVGGKVDYANVLALLTRLKQICDHPRLAEITAARAQGANSETLLLREAPPEAAVEGSPDAAAPDSALNEGERPLRPVPKKSLVKKTKADHKPGTFVVDPMDSGKWETFSELVEEALGSGLKIVVFTQYLGMMDLVGAYLRSKSVGYTDLRGDTPDRGARLERFAKDPDCRVFVCSLLAGGLGIDLTSASVCIHLDRWWNPAKENQATDRLHRFGQTRGVQVFKLQIPGTVEDRIASIIESKIALSGALIEQSSIGLKAFSRKELLDLLAPDREGASSDSTALSESTSASAEPVAVHAPSPLSLESFTLSTAGQDAFSSNPGTPGAAMMDGGMDTGMELGDVDAEILDDPEAATAFAAAQRASAAADGVGSGVGSDEPSVHAGAASDESPASAGASVTILRKASASAPVTILRKASASAPATILRKASDAVVAPPASAPKRGRPRSRTRPGSQGATKTRGGIGVAGSRSRRTR